MGITEAVLKIALRKPRIESFDRVLFFGPHPDDIEIGCGATVSKLSRLGKNIRFVICTDGRYGSSTVKPEDLVRIREKEALLGAGRLGVNDVHFLHFSDGAFYDQDDLLKAMACEIADFSPDIIFSPDPFVSNENHQDHLNVAYNARRLSCFAPYEGIMGNYGLSSAPLKAICYYMSARNNTVCKVTKEDFHAQLDALKMHKSQFRADASVFTYLRLRSFEYGLKRFRAHAEGFRMLTETEMHCLPEKGL